jgi:hypothetical protein
VNPPFETVTALFPVPRGEKECDLSPAKAAFDIRIAEASDLLEHFNHVEAQPPPAIDVVLKRACLVMALTAFESYIRDRLNEAADQKYAEARNSWLTQVYTDALAKDLKVFRFTAVESVKELFTKHFSIDVAKGWTWNGFDSAQACAALDELAKSRLDAGNASPLRTDLTPAVVTREELGMRIQFVRNLVLATEIVLASEL